MKCPHCIKEFSEPGLRSHIWHAHTEEGKNFTFKGRRQKPAWNKGLTKEDNRVLKYSTSISKSQKGRTGKKHSKETKEKLSIIAINRNLGGHTSKIKLYYKKKDGGEVYLQSSYEIDLAKDLDKNNINWIRPNFLFWLDDDKKKHRYYPDFYLTDYDVYLDPKNSYLQKKDKRKIELVIQQNNVRLIILDKSTLNWNSLKQII